MDTTKGGATPIGVFEKREPLRGLDETLHPVDEVLVYPDGSAEGIVHVDALGPEDWAVIFAERNGPSIGLPAGVSGDVSRARRTALVLLSLDTEFTEPESLLRGCR
jgi:hypothetical protein